MTLLNILWVALSATANTHSVEEKYQELISDKEALAASETETAELQDLPLEALTYKDLYRDISIQQKWSILADIAKKSPEFAKGVYLSCIESTDWLLRVGGLKFLAEIDAQLAIEKAQKIIETDAALLVRSAAVDVLIELGSVVRAKDTLWTALKDTKNFHKGNSLWIRQNIAVALQEFTDKSENELWAEYLDDKDIMVRVAAIKALEKNNLMQLGTQTDSVDVRSALWKTKLSEVVQPIAEPNSLYEEISKKNSSGNTIKSQKSGTLLSPDGPNYPELQPQIMEL